MTQSLNQLKAVIKADGLEFHIVNSEISSTKNSELHSKSTSVLMTRSDAIFLVSKILSCFERREKAVFLSQNYLSCFDEDSEGSKCCDKRTEPEGPVQLELDLFRRST